MITISSPGLTSGGNSALHRLIGGGEVPMERRVSGTRGVTGLGGFASLLADSPTLLLAVIPKAFMSAQRDNSVAKWFMFEILNK